MSRNTSQGESISVDPSISTNKDQQWYRNLCRSGKRQPSPPMEQQMSYLSPQRIQLQMQLQREYQQRQELQKNCRQEWWQRKSGPSPTGGTPMAFHTPSPAHKFYAGAAMMQQDMSFYQHTPRPAPSPPSPVNGYFQQTAGDGVRAGVDPRIGNEREWLEEQEKRLHRERMLRAAHMIKSETEKRMKDTQPPQLTACKEQEIIQHKILQLLKEHELAEQYRSPDLNPTNPRNFRPTVQPSYSYNPPSDLQYKIAKLIEAYRRVPTNKLQSAPHQKNWQDQITTYNNMLQAHNQGNLNQSYQEAKLLLQQLLQKEPNASPCVNSGSEFYPTPHLQQQANNYYQQLNQLRQAYLGPPGAQPIFRTPYPRQQAARPRRDPRINQSSCSSMGGVLDITPRLNQSYQCSEQDITQEILYAAGPVDTSTSTGTQVNGRLNSTPRKPYSSESFQDKNGNDTSKQGDTQQEEAPTQNKSPKRSTPKKDSKKSPGKESGEMGLKVTFSSTVTKHQSEQCDNESTTRPGRKLHVHDWKQLEQRSRHHRRGQRFPQHGHREIDTSGQQGMHEDLEERQDKPNLTMKDKAQKDDTNQQITAKEEQEEKPSNDMKHNEDGQNVEQKRNVPFTKTQVRIQTVGKPSLKIISKTSAIERQQQKGTQTSEFEKQAIAAAESREPTEALASTHANAETEERKTGKHVTIREPEMSRKHDAQTTSSEPSGSDSENASAKTAVAHDTKKTHIESKAEPVRGVQPTRVLKRDPKQQSQQLKESLPQHPQRDIRQSPRSTPPKPQAQMRRSSRSPQQLSESRQPQSGPIRENRRGSRSPRNCSSNPVESKHLESATTKPSAKKSPGGISTAKSHSPTTTTSTETTTRGSETQGNARSPGSSSVSSRNYSPRRPSTTSPGSDQSGKTDTSPTLYKRRRRRNWRRSRDKPYDHQEEGQPRGQHIKPWERSQNREKQKVGTGYDSWAPGSRRRSWQWEDSRAIPIKKMKSIGQQNDSFASNEQHQYLEKSTGYKSDLIVPKPSSKPEQSPKVKITHQKASDKTQSPASKLVPNKTDGGQKEQHKLDSAGLHRVGDEQTNFGCSFAPAEESPSKKDKVQPEDEDNQSVDDATREAAAAMGSEKGATPEKGKGADGEGVAFHEEDGEGPDTKPETGISHKKAAGDEAETRLEHVLAVLAGLKGRCVDDRGTEGEPTASQHDSSEPTASQHDSSEPVTEGEPTASQHDSSEPVTEGLEDHSSADPTTECTPEQQQVSKLDASEVIPVESHAHESPESKETDLLLSSDASFSIPRAQDNDSALNETDQKGQSKTSVPIDSCQSTDVSAGEQVARKEKERREGEIDTVSAVVGNKSSELEGKQTTVSTSVPESGTAVSESSKLEENGISTTVECGGSDSGNGSLSSDQDAKRNSNYTANDAERLNQTQNKQHTTTDFPEQRELSSEISKPETIDDGVNAGCLPGCQDTTIHATVASENSTEVPPEVSKLGENTNAGKSSEDGREAETLSAQVLSRNIENVSGQTGNASCGEIIVIRSHVNGTRIESGACAEDYEDEDVVVCGEITSIVGSESEKQLCDDVMSLLMGHDTDREPPTDTKENLEKEQTAEYGAEVERSTVGQVTFFLDHSQQSERNIKDKQEQHFEGDEMCPHTCCLLRRNSQDPTSTTSNIVTGDNLVDKLTEYGII